MYKCKNCGNTVEDAKPLRDGEVLCPATIICEQKLLITLAFFTTIAERGIGPISFSSRAPKALRHVDRSCGA